MPEPDHFHANLQRGAILLDNNRPKEALPYIQAAIAANPDAPHAYAELARCWNEIPPDRHKSIDAINRAIALAPQVSHFHGRKGWFCVCLLQYRAAKKAADDGLAINPLCITSLNALANAHTKLAQWKKAEEACHRILALDPHDAPALNLLAQAYRHQGRWKESRETVARLLAQMPDNAFGHANAGYGALAAGDHLRANEHFLASLRMNPHFDLARRGLLTSLRARIWIIRVNMRMKSTLRQSPTWRSIAQAYLLGIGILCTAVGIGLAANYFMPQNGSEVIGFLVGGFILYIYLSAAALIITNFFLLFDPIGRHALTRKEKVQACFPLLVFVPVVVALLVTGERSAALIILAVVALLALSTQFPLLKDRWLRRREAMSID